TMRAAQKLYEGVEVGDQGSVGLITYMRTDSVRVSDAAIKQAREYINAQFDKRYLPDEPNVHKGGRGSKVQDAHEAIRPTEVGLTPDDLKKYLERDLFKLYQLIWRRFLASQMTPAVYEATKVDFELADGKFLFRATGSRVLFDGYHALYSEAHEAEDAKTLDSLAPIPKLAEGDRATLKQVVPSQHFTEPPPRYSEASLVKELERLGIGRPSTYASLISVLADRRYVELQQRRFFPTELGETVEKVMVKQFPDIFNVGFTSEMEEELDKVEGGELNWQRVLRDFYKPFEKSLNKVDASALIAAAHDLSEVAKLRCPDCGGKLEPRGGFFGPFLACENHPKKCKYTRPLKGERAKPVMTEHKCHLCGAPMVIRQGRSGQFLGCSTFPKCRGTRSMPTGVFCPKDGGELVERRSRKRGTPFYACSNESCDFVVWNKPVAEKCPECGYLGAEVKFTKARGEYRKC